MVEMMVDQVPLVLLAIQDPLVRKVLRDQLVGQAHLVHRVPPDVTVKTGLQEVMENQADPDLVVLMDQVVHRVRQERLVDQGRLVIQAVTDVMADQVFHFKVTSCIQNRYYTMILLQ